jgi:hypothetical protein
LLLKISRATKISTKEKKAATGFDSYENPANGIQVGYLDAPFVERPSVHAVVLSKHRWRKQFGDQPHFWPGVGLGQGWYQNVEVVLLWRLL